MLLGLPVQSEPLCSRMHLQSLCNRKWHASQRIPYGQEGGRLVGSCDCCGKRFLGHGTRQETAILFNSWATLGTSYCHQWTLVVFFRKNSCQEKTPRSRHCRYSSSIGCLLILEPVYSWATTWMVTVPLFTTQGRAQSHTAVSWDRVWNTEGLFCY